MSDYTNFTLETDTSEQGGGIALLTWDMPGKSMNVIDEPVMQELDSIIDHVVATDDIKGVVLTSGKKAFGAGADLTMLQGLTSSYEETAKSDPHAAASAVFESAYRLNQALRKMETCGKPFVAAINGVCLGGIFEITLACHARVVADDDRITMGLPEVKVGLLPGGGGTQRVPRLVADQQAALQMLLLGGNIRPKKAKQMGLVHEVVPAEDLIATAKEMAKTVKPVAPWDEKGFRAPKIYSAAGMMLWPAANATLRKNTYANYPAATNILKSVFEGIQLPIDTALRVESRYFANTLMTKEARAMIRSLFVSLQELNKGARRPDVETTPLKKVGVVGAGFMGAGIAYVTAKAGIEVVLIDRDQASADKGKAWSETTLDAAIKKKRSTPEKKDALLNLITATSDYSKLDDCDLIVEAVFEDKKVKEEVTGLVDAATADSTIYASNTSTIPITELSAYSKNADKFIGIHFFSPVDKMMLVEIIMGENTGDEALAKAIDYVLAIKKTPIVVQDTRGFYVNRAVIRYMGEAWNMLSEGVPPAMIENLAKAAGMPVGPLALNDEVAIDLSQKVMRQTRADLGDDAVEQRHVDLVDTMVSKGRVGKKAGKGFYEYPDKPAKKHLWPELSDLYDQQAPDEIDNADVRDRFLYTIALEAARCVEEGVVTDIREADVGAILGFGFAPFTGGPISFIDGLGADRFVARAKELAAKYGDHFDPPKLLTDMAASGESFYGTSGSAARKAA